MNNNVEGFTNREIINREAAEWILFLEETPELTPKEIEALNLWVATSDIHRESLEAMATSWGEMDLLASVMHPPEMQKQSSLSNAIKFIFTPINRLCHFTFCQLKKLLHPAVLTPTLASIVFTLIYFVLQPPIENKTLDLTTGIGENITHEMPDGSVLWLNSSSHIKLNYSDEYRRINLIAGEAHFEVAKDPNRPFEVFANDRLIKAIGTAFSVHKLENSIEVLVSEGTVELAIIDNALVVVPDDLQTTTPSKNKNTDIVAIPTNNRAVAPLKVTKVLSTLAAGQRVSIPILNDKLGEVDELNSSEVTRFLSWKEGKLVFAGESLEEVIAEITRHTEVKIELDDPTLKSIRIGGQFQVGETDSLFYVLESGFGISIDRISDQHVKLYLK